MNPDGCVGELPIPVPEDMSRADAVRVLADVFVALFASPLLFDTKDVA